MRSRQFFLVLGFEPLSLAMVAYFHFIYDPPLALEVGLALLEKLKLLSTPSLNLSSLILFGAMQDQVGLPPLLLVQFDLPLNIEVQILLTFGQFKASALSQLEPLINLLLMEGLILKEHSVDELLVCMGRGYRGFDILTDLRGVLPVSDSFEKREIEGCKGRASGDTR